MDSYFTWNEQKAQSNKKKHGVSFEEAITVFRDPLAYVFDDDPHSLSEKREIIIGYLATNRLLVVSYAPRGELFRVISARLATKRERKDYEENAIY
jgi:uncharacterized DUF497 family protein